MISDHVVGAENLCHLAGCTAGCSRPAPTRAWDDLRLVGLKLIFLIVTRAVSLLGLSRRECVVEGRRVRHEALLYPDGGERPSIIPLS